jgi:hypothetical protein
LDVLRLSGKFLFFQFLYEFLIGGLLEEELKVGVVFRVVVGQFGIRCGQVELLWFGKEQVAY